ncbi:DUF7507 domain-containing protein [Pseudolysinimonas kribbensis]|uniref:DUF7507 domain-containing protein n=1 Tax=Pseudolysinimonas kribbensis TaxID=433641 RepID=UPI0024E0B999|nr:hypothetical protein [Pseudolysinimonas kribbensis]
MPALRSLPLRLAAAAGAAALIASGLALGLVAQPASAAPGNPGVPSDGTLVYQEDFQNAPVAGATRIAGYTSSSGATYTADPVYQNTTLCNGLIFGHQATNAALGAQSFCGASSGWWPSARTIPSGIGLYNGMTDPTQNLAVADQTVGGTSNNYTGTMLQGNGITVPTSGRFLTFSVQVGNLCSTGVQALDRFYLLDGGSAIPLNTTDYNICADPNRRSFAVDAATVTVGTFTGNQSALVTSSTIGFRLTNQQPSGSGNDQAFDNFKILDVTPQLDKAFSPAIVPTGGASALTFTVTNTSELAAKNGWSFTDALPSGLRVAAVPAISTTCPSGVVTAAAGSTSVAATGDLAAGMASCTVTVQVASATTGVAYTNGPGNVTTVGLNPPGSSTVHFESPALTLVKHAGTPTDANGDGITNAGDTIGYTFTVTNTGDVALTDVGVTDAKAGPVTCPSTTLAPGDTETCTADALYTVTPDDVAAHAVDNTATAHGTPPSGVVTTSPPSTTSTPAADPAPALTVVKSATPSGDATFQPGQTITYDFVVTNTGNVTMSDIAIDDSTFTGTGSLPTPTCAQTTLAPGEQTLCTADYTLSGGDVDAGSVSNTATVTGTPPGSEIPVPSEPSTIVVPTPEAPGITLSKTATPTTVDAAGQSVTYSFLVTNTGNVTLSAIDVPETTFTGTGTLGALDCPRETLLAGQFETCSADYTVTQADIDAGGVVSNTATATGVAPSGVVALSIPSTATVNVTRTPALTLAKTADVTAAAAGQHLTYSFLVTNTGNVTITDPVIDEGAFSGSGALSAIQCPTGPISLAPGDDVSCTADYTATQDDVDSGALTNTATVTGTPPDGTTPPVSPPSTSVVTTSPAPALTIVKTADAAKVTRAGQVVTYSFAVTNTGNVTITDPVVHEGAFTGHGTLSAIACPDSASTLSPAESVTCTATYTVVDADLVRGSRLSNSATVSGTLRGGGTITSDPSTSRVLVDPPGGLALTGSDLLLPGVAMALVLLLAGGLAIVIRRRRGDGSPTD